MRIITWNLNGLLSSVHSDALAPIMQLEPDVLCLQEIRTVKEPVIFRDYHHFWNHSKRDGYSGTAVLTRQQPLRVISGFGSDGEDNEGRVITVELPDSFITCVYAPNSQKNLQRRAYRLNWDARFRRLAVRLREEKPAVLCGDFNVTRAENDIYEENLRQYWAQLGYASDERSNFETLLEEGFVDAFRHLYPEERSYTWWSNRLNKRRDNRGWRLDYFLVDESISDAILEVRHLTEICGSDHCPVLLEIDL